ncbi:hypothetical protein OBBRIDRAFT_824258 [Obba rivulosa]|uniref:DRBM domain-containing protein n=1 Tax=Obba rivulosa TaxID=1052685 RepID=A0A8E2DMS7_9APHY|nr:hypothetical protein OBBRIDRAFT_824258 [Obba rivulosa]
MAHWRMQLNNAISRLSLGLNVVNWSDHMSGPRYSPTWTSIVLINGVQYGVGHGRSKDASREEAACQAYATLTAQHGLQ